SAYQDNAIQFEGFRCPYLSYTDELTAALPNGDCQYSSNKAIWWDVEPVESGSEANSILQGLSRFYRPESAQSQISVPRTSGHLIEIPVCLPDDLQLLDGFQLTEADVARAWTNLLRLTHQ